MITPASDRYDVIIVGGGPGGSTAATLLKKYSPALRVLILEREVFPRDHIGESQLPSISAILHEMGVWEKVEAAGFPVKIGASYTWGRTSDQWDFDFYPLESWRDEPRPAKYEGQRKFTAFQVDRAIYDTILLNHAREFGAEAREGVKVDEVLAEGDRITGLRLSTGQTVEATHYIDASGNAGVIRRAMGIDVDVTQELRNVAIWDYWLNAEWAERIGVGATRVQVRSLPYGWIWFIPLGPTRTSIGVICNAEAYKKMGKSPEELYVDSLASQPQISQLVAKGTRENKLTSCKDWSQLADRLHGENYFLVGEAAGFADPILAAGMSLAHSSARDAAYTILELERGGIEPVWLRERYNDRNRTNIRQHIRFGQFWYSSNGCFTDLQEHCSRIAAEAGLKFNPQQAWQWLAQGGFITEALGLPTFGSFDVASAKQILDRFAAQGKPLGYLASGYNTFELNLRGAKKTKIGNLVDGRIEMIDAWERGEHKLPLAGIYGGVVKVLERTTDAEEMFKGFRDLVIANKLATGATVNTMTSMFLQALEVMIEQYWVTRSVNKKRPVMTLDNAGQRYIRSRTETMKALEEHEPAATIQFNYT